MDASRVWRRAIPAALVAAVAMAVAGPAAGATIDIPAQIVVKSVARSFPNDPNRCLAVAFMMYPDTPGATRYSGLADGIPPSSDVAGGGPPFPDDVYETTIGTFTVPGGNHWFPLGSYSVGTGCADAEAGATGRFTVAYMRAEVPSAPQNQPPVAAATVTRVPGQPREFTFDGSASRDPDGTITSYAWRFGDGGTASGPRVTHRYTAGGNRTATLTVTDAGGATGSTTRTVGVPFAVSGTLKARTCGPRTCSVAPVRGVTVGASGAGSESDVTDAKGRYTLQLAQGAWRIAPRGGGKPWNPRSRAIIVSRNVGGQDFIRCAQPAQPTTQRSNELRTEHAGGDPCTFTLSGTVRSAVDDRPFSRPLRILGGNGRPVLFRVEAVGSASGVREDISSVSASGRFRLRVPAGVYRLRFVTPEEVFPVHSLPALGLRVVADRDQTGLALRVRPTVDGMSMSRVSGTERFTYVLAVLDHTDGGAGPVTASASLTRDPGRPLDLYPRCSQSASDGNPTRVSFVMRPAAVPEGPGVTGNDVPRPLCAGNYQGVVTVGANAERLATFRVNITGGFQSSVRLLDLRYQGRFAG